MVLSVELSGQLPAVAVPTILIVLAETSVIDARPSTINISAASVATPPIPRRCMVFKPFPFSSINIPLLTSALISNS